MAAIQAASSGTAAKTSTTTPAKTAAAAPATGSPTPAWKTTNWGNELSIDWGARNPKPVVAETPVGYEPADISLTPVLPLPPPVSAGIQVALRDHRKKVVGRKVS